MRPTRFDFPLDRRRRRHGAGLAYALVGGAPFRLRRVDVPVLAPGATPIRILHISDLHMTPGQQGKWLGPVLAALEPDLVVNTGDNLAHLRRRPRGPRRAGPLLGPPGVFVFGSNDYYAPILKNPLRYLKPQPTPGRSRRPPAVAGPARRVCVAPAGST